MSWTTPPTYTTGQVLTSTSMNGNTGDLSYLYGDLTWSTPGSFSNSWSNTGNCAYRKVGVVNNSGTVVPFTSPGGGVALDGLVISADV
jgi:hypothetical protein